MSKEMSITDLSQKFSALYGPNSSFIKDLNEEDANLIELCCGILSSGYHPCSSFSSEVIDRIYKITNVNFNNFIVPDALIPSSPSLDLLSENKPFDPDTNIPSNVACSFFSQNNNLSQDYEYANTVDVPTCSNSQINGIYCISSNYQNRCPFYKADYSRIATHIINESNKQYVYKVYKYRTVDSRIIVSIFNQDNVLVNQLGYFTEAISQLPQGAFEEEMLSIINEVHAKAFFDTAGNFETDYPLIEQSNSKSYISTLIS